MPSPYPGANARTLDADVMCWQKHQDRAFAHVCRDLPAGKKFYAGGRLVGADLTPEQSYEVYQKAKALAAGLGEGQRRGRVAHFSRRSRKRLLEFVARLRPDVSGLMITFTYADDMRDHQEAKKHLDLALRWLRRRVPGACFVWKLEYQKRGAIHFHIMALGIRRLDKHSQFLPLIAYWQKMGGAWQGTHIRTIENRRKAMSYAAKYIGKVLAAEDAPPAGFTEDGAPAGTSAVGAVLDNMPYSENASFVGRFWGISNRKMIPWAEEITVEYYGRSASFMQFRRQMRRYLADRYKLPGKVQGFTAFVKDAFQWWRCFNHTAARDNLFSAGVPYSASRRAGLHVRPRGDVIEYRYELVPLPGVYAAINF
jgi:hypothetical protein